MGWGGGGMKDLPSRPSVVAYMYDTRHPPRTAKLYVRLLHARRGGKYYIYIYIYVCKAEGETPTDGRARSLTSVLDGRSDCMVK